MLRAILFDFDGTLADTIPAITEGVNLAMRQYGFPTHTEDDVRSFINNGPRMLIRRALPRELQENECLLDRVLSDYDKLYKTVCRHTHRAYDGVSELIDRLRARGFSIGVLSNKQHDLLCEICRGIFSNRVDAIVGTVPDHPTKPDPYLASKLADELGVQMQDCVMIGDSDVDIRIAENAGMEHVGVTWGYRDRAFLQDHGAKHIADTPKELESLINNLFLKGSDEHDQN